MGMFFLSHQESSKYLMKMILLEISEYQQNEIPENGLVFCLIFF